MTSHRDALRRQSRPRPPNYVDTGVPAPHRPSRHPKIMRTRWGEGVLAHRRTDVSLHTSDWVETHPATPSTKVARLHHPTPRVRCIVPRLHVTHRCAVLGKQRNLWGRVGAIRTPHPSGCQSINRDLLTPLSPRIVSEHSDYFAPSPPWEWCFILRRWGCVRFYPTV
jgi:hypothetical protein